MYIDPDRLLQLTIALIVGAFYFFVIIARVKRLLVIASLIILWAAGWLMMRDVFMQVVLMLNNNVYPLGLEHYIILGQDIFLALLVFTIGKLKFVNDES